MHSFVTLAEQLLLKTKWNKPTLTSRQKSLMDPFLFLISSNISLSLTRLASWQILFYKITSCLYHSHIHTKKRGWTEGGNTSVLISINDNYKRLNFLFLVWFYFTLCFCYIEAWHEYQTAPISKESFIFSAWITVKNHCPQFPPQLLGLDSQVQLDKKITTRYTRNIH